MAEGDAPRLWSRLIFISGALVLVAAFVILKSVYPIYIYWSRMCSWNPYPIYMSLWPRLSKSQTLLSSFTLQVLLKLNKDESHLICQIKIKVKIDVHKDFWLGQSWCCAIFGNLIPMTNLYHQIVKARQLNKEKSHQSWFVWSILINISDLCKVVASPMIFLVD